MTEAEHKVRDFETQFPESKITKAKHHLGLGKLRQIWSLRSTPGAELSRTWETSYRVWDAETSWFLHRDTAVRVCEAGACSYRTRTWLNLSQSGSRKWFVPHVEVRNPGAGGGCTGDCVRETSGYDALGNRELTTVDGGYGTGFGALAVTTRTGHRHGRPVRRQLESGGVSLLRWQREVDPGTGLVRWHMAGNGSGFAYGYDAVGRLTELAPVEGDLVGGEWRLELPRSVDGATMVGSHLERVPPETSELLRHELHDAAYALVPAGGSRRLEAVWVDPDPSAAVDFDGLGRITRQQERYPSGSGVRTRLSLDLYRDGFDPCGTGQGTALEHTSRVALASDAPRRGHLHPRAPGFRLPPRQHRLHDRHGPSGQPGAGGGRRTRPRRRASREDRGARRLGLG